MAVTFINKGNKKGAPKKKKIIDNGVVFNLKKENVWVAKSCLQKSFRRNHVGLLKQSFAHLIQEGELDWLIKRAMIFAAEDAWRSTLNISTALYELKQEGHLKVGGDKDLVAKVMLDLLLQEAGTAKNKDGNNLRQVARIITTTRDSHSYKYSKQMSVAVANRVSESEYQMVLDLVDIHVRVFAQGSKYRDQIKKEWAVVWDRVSDFEDDSDNYQDLRQAVGGLYFRQFTGGCVDTQLLLMTSALLVIDSYEREEPIVAPASKESILTDSFGDMNEGLPWGMWDMHTSKGKKVLKQICKKYEGRYTPELIEEIWFTKESALVNEDDPDSVWLTLQANLLYRVLGISPKHADKVWFELGQDIKSCLIGQ